MFLSNLCFLVLFHYFHDSTYELLSFIIKIFLSHLWLFQFYWVSRHIFLLGFPISFSYHSLIITGYALIFPRLVRFHRSYSLSCLLYCGLIDCTWNWFLRCICTHNVYHMCSEIQHFIFVKLLLYNVPSKLQIIAYLRINVFRSFSRELHIKFISLTGKNRVCIAFFVYYVSACIRLLFSQKNTYEVSIRLHASLFC